jgi:hypothetical protein
MNGANNKEIHKLYRNEQFDRILSGNEKTALIVSQLVATNLLGNNKSNN